MTFRQLLVTLSLVPPLSIAGQVVIEQEVMGVSPEMINWWWDNINSTERYQMWHPTDNISFKWVYAPSNPNHLNYSVGAIQKITENIGGHEANVDITYLDPSEAIHTVTYNYWINAKMTWADLPEQGSFIHEYEANSAGDGTMIRSTISFPSSLKTDFPKYPDALILHTQEKMQNLRYFLPGLFHQEFIENELLSRGSVKQFTINNSVKKLIVDQEIKGVTPDMLNWWWNNISTTKRFKQWHPTDHISYKQSSDSRSPAHSPTPTQEIVEFIGGYETNILISFLDPLEAQEDVDYEHWLNAKTQLKSLSSTHLASQKMIHEYTLNETGDGSLMRSTFMIPHLIDIARPGFSTGLGQHTLQEMQLLQYFLPKLYQEEHVEHQGQSSHPPQ